MYSSSGATTFVRFYFVLFLFLAMTAQAVQALPIAPPRRPDIAPKISPMYTNDKNRDSIDDVLLDKAESALADERRSVTQMEKQTARAKLSGTVEVELIFKKQITQEQIDAFLQMGGEISHIYKAVSYGWNGKIPLRKVKDLSSFMGPDMLLLEEAKKAELHMRLATRTGRVRPVWAGGFAGSSGYDGDGSISIAIIDTGVDDSHTDLSGRSVFWKDYSSDNESAPRDIFQHGTHVAGIALGTGASLGAGSTLSYTDSGSLSGVSIGSFYPSVIDFPSVSTTWSSTATWLGGGATTLYHAYTAKGSSTWYGVTSSSGSSGLNLNTSFTPLSSRAYSTALLSNGLISTYAVANTMTNYQSVGDGFNTVQGVARGCKWVGAKVFTNSGSGYMSWTGAAIDDMVNNRAAYNIKVMNLSLGANGDPGISDSTRQKINNAAQNGILPVVSAGNDGPGNTGTNEVDDPGRAAMALTVGAANDVNELTEYTSSGFTSPGQEEDYKPDVLAPGGSDYYSNIMSVDSNDADGGNSSFPDVQSNDYYNIKGTSMASPFAAGAAALLIDALQQTGGLNGAVWDFSSSNDVRRVKMLLCATATETNTDREAGTGFNPTLERASNGPSGYPAGKDMYEGYGMLNVDAAIEGGTVLYSLGSTETATLGGSNTARRTWARKMIVAAGIEFNLTLTVPASGDFDLYMYDFAPGPYGTPAIVASSTNTGNGIAESINYTPASASNILLVVKRVSGSGEFTLTGNFTTYPLVVSKAGAGSGTVTSAPAGINCGADCTEDYPVDTVVTLTAAPDAGSTFTGWSGDADCSDGVVTMNVLQNCIADFNLITYTLDVSRSGTGSGTVTSNPSGINCGPDCTEVYAIDTEVTMAATPDADSTFAGWSGDADCSDGILNMSAGKSCTAAFNLIQYQLTTVIYPVGGGSVSPDCIVGCWYDIGTIVTLTGTENNEYYFDIWTNCDSQSNNICTETMDSDDTVTANFQACPLPVRIADEPPVYYGTLQAAYDDVSDGATIQSRAVIFADLLNANRVISVTLEGGYDCNYTVKEGVTTFNGTMTISKGVITIGDYIFGN